MTDTERLARARSVAAEWHDYALKARSTFHSWAPLANDPFARGLDAGHTVMAHALGCILEALGQHSSNCSPACACRGR